jgi:hypothetical protein
MEIYFFFGALTFFMGFPQQSPALALISPQAEHL